MDPIPMSTTTALRSTPLEPLSLARGPERQPQVVRSDPVEAARLQTLRGIACLLVVGFHAVGSTADSGLHVRDDSYYREFFNLIVHMPMPLFTFLSGLVYAYRPVRVGHALAFSTAKLRRLGLPLFVASTLLYCVHLAMHHQVAPLSQMWTIYVFPYWHLWFAQALLLVFAAIVMLESLGALSTFPQFMLVLAVSVGLYSYGPFERQNILGVHNATYLLPFFLAGLGAHRYRDLLRPKPVLLATVFCFVISQGFHSYIVLTRVLAPIVPVDDRSGLHLLIGLSASLSGLQLLPRLRLMEKIGESSYPIYLYHPFFVAAVLFAAGAHVLTLTCLVFAFGTIAGIAGPMGMERVACRIPGGQLLLEGRSPASENLTDLVRSIRDRIRRGLAKPVPSQG
jgi:peptidoglycan/LPS O-acetylase OafA/YrhL